MTRRVDQAILDDDARQQADRDVAAESAYILAVARAQRQAEALAFLEQRHADAERRYAREQAREAAREDGTLHEYSLSACAGVVTATLFMLAVCAVVFSIAVFGLPQ